VKEKRALVQQAKAEHDVNLLCEILELSRSSFYYTCTVEDESELRDMIEQICLKNTRYGYRRITDQLHRAGIQVGEEKVRLLMSEMKLSVKPLHPKVQTTKSGKGKPLYPNLIKGLDIIHPNQVWCGAITFIPLSSGKMAYLAVLIDVFTHDLEGYEFLSFIVPVR